MTQIEQLVKLNAELREQLEISRQLIAACSQLSNASLRRRKADRWVGEE